MSLYQPPKCSHEKSPFWVFLDYLVKWATSERVFIPGCQVVQKADGKYFTLPKNLGGGGQQITFKCCKEDGSTCYVTVQALAIYAGPGTGTVEATIPPGSVIPTGSTVII